MNGRFFFRFILANDCETLNPNGVYEDSDEKKEENFLFLFFVVVVIIVFFFLNLTNRIEPVYICRNIKSVASNSSSLKKKENLNLNLNSNFK